MYPDTAGREGCPCSTEMENLTTTGQMKHGRLVYAQIDMMRDLRVECATVRLLVSPY